MRNTVARSAKRDGGPDAALQHALHHERPANVALRRTDEVHDFDFVTPGVEGQPDHVGDGQRGGECEERAEKQTNSLEHGDRRLQAVQPLPVVANICHAGCRTKRRGQLIDRLLDALSRLELISVKDREARRHRGCRALKGVRSLSRRLYTHGH